MVLQRHSTTHQRNLSDVGTIQPISDDGCNFLLRISAGAKVMGGRGSGRPRSTACKCGLPYDFVDSAGQRKCKTCERARARKRRKPSLVPRNKIHARYVVRDYKIAQIHCVICQTEINENNFMMFALDHRDPTKKLFNLSDARSKPIDLVLAECRKCDLMCHNCHHVKTHQNRDHLTRRDEIITQDEYLPLLLLMQESQ